MEENKTAITHEKKKVKAPRGLICENLNFATKEAFKRLRTNVMLALPGENDDCRILGVTSAQPAEGKSTIAVNLSYSIAELGKRVVLIDGDMRRPSVHTMLGIERSPGLGELLNTAKNDTATISFQKYFSSKNDTTFDIIPAGYTNDNASELLDSRRMGTLLRFLSNKYDYIILDLPPIGVVVDAVPVSKLTDGMLVVIRENYCPRGVFSDCIDQLKLANVNILGFVVNGALEGARKNYQYNYYS